MKKSPFAIGASLALALSLLVGAAAMAQDNTTGTAKAPTTGNTKPHLGNGPAVEKSLPSSAPAATRTKKTGSTKQSNAVKKMNSEEKAKVETTGK
jgi:hypothetical protein